MKSCIKKIDEWKCPAEPRIPNPFYKDMIKSDKVRKYKYGNPNYRLWMLASSSGKILRKELDTYLKENNNSIITETTFTLDTNKNKKFKEDISKSLEVIENRLNRKLVIDLDGNNEENKTQANIWISVVDENGEYKYIYHRGDIFNNRRIGSISKVFASIALANRGDKYDYYYCNEYYRGLHNSDGRIGGECKENINKNIISAMKVFGSSKNLPIKSAFDKYIIKDNKNIKIIQDKISEEKLSNIYSYFNLSRDSNNTTLSYEMSFGTTNSSPYKLQKSIHKFAYLLYYKSQYVNYQEAHIGKNIKYILKGIHSNNREKEVVTYNKYLDRNITNLFSSNSSRQYMQTVLKTPVSKKYGTLKSLNPIEGYKPLFMKSGTTDKEVKGKILTQSKWVTGAFKITNTGKQYSFVIMIHKESGIGEKITHSKLIKPIFNVIINNLKND